MEPAGLCDSKEEVCFPAEPPGVADGSPSAPLERTPAPDAGPPTTNLHRGANAPPAGGARPERRDRNKTVLRNAGCVLRVSGEEGRRGPARGGSYGGEGGNGPGDVGAAPLAGRPRWPGWLE